MFPRWISGLVAAVLTGGVILDLTLQAIVPGHTVNPLVIAPMLAAIGAALAGMRGPTPPTPPGTPPDPTPLGRHRTPEDPT